MSEEIKAVGEEPETYVEPVYAAPVHVAYAKQEPKPSTWQRDKLKGGWYRVVADGDAQGHHVEAVTDAEFVEFERSARVAGKDLLRGKKLEQRLAALLTARALPHLALTDWADGPVFSPRVPDAAALPDATGTP